MLNKVPFWTPIEWSGRPLANFADKYLSFGSKSAIQVSILEDRVFVQEKEAKSSWILTALKLATMILTFGILPLLALIVKSIYRCRHQVFWIQKEPEPIFVSEEKFESYVGSEIFETLPMEVLQLPVLRVSQEESPPASPPEISLEELSSVLTPPPQPVEESEMSREELYAELDRIFPPVRESLPQTSGCVAAAPPPLIEVNFSQAPVEKPTIRTDAAYCREYLAKVAESFRFDPNLSPDMRFYILEWEKVDSPQSKYNRLLFDYALELLGRPQRIHTIYDPYDETFVKVNMAGTSPIGPKGGIFLDRPESPVTLDTLVSRAKFAPAEKSYTPSNVSAALSVFELIALEVERVTQESAEALATQIVLKTKDLDLKALFGADFVAKFRNGNVYTCHYLGQGNCKKIFEDF